MQASMVSLGAASWISFSLNRLMDRMKFQAILLILSVHVSILIADSRYGRRLQSIEFFHGEARAIEATDSENPVAAAQVKSL